MKITAEIARKYLRYDPGTGEFIRLIATAKRTKVGDKAGYLSGCGYRYLRLLGEVLKCNRLAWLMHYGEWPTQHVDHMNGDRSDDRISNLRQCSPLENAQNRISPKGAYKTKHGKYTASVTKDGKAHYLGRFSTESAARSAYVEAKLSLHPFAIKETLNA